MSETAKHTTHDHHNLHVQCPVRMEILAIDSSPVSLKYLVALLNKCNYRVMATTKAEEALDMLRKNKDKFNLVITNVVRHDIDSFKLLKTISVDMDIPVIIVSADEKIENIMKAIKYGARDYLFKPLRLMEIKNIWQHVVRKTLEKEEENRKIIYVEKEAISIPRETSEIISSINCGEHKKSRIQWSQERHQKFVQAVESLGIDNAIPSKILKIMRIPELTRENVASHLQKYKIMLKQQKEAREGQQNTEISIPKNVSPNVILHNYNYMLNEDTISNHTLPNGSYFPGLYQSIFPDLEQRLGNELVLYQNTLSGLAYNDGKIRIGHHTSEQSQMTIDNEMEDNDNDDDELRTTIQCLLDDGPPQCDVLL